MPAGGTALQATRLTRTSGHQIVQIFQIVTTVRTVVDQSMATRSADQQLRGLPQRVVCGGTVVARRS